MSLPKRLKYAKKSSAPIFSETTELIIYWFRVN